MAATLSIIIPAFNESARLGRSLETIYEYLNHAYPDAEVIVVDDGSSDDTVQIAEASFETAGKINCRLIRIKPNRGKGHAVRQGLRAATAPIALFSDADLSTPVTEIPKLVTAIEQEGYDLVFGSRALDRGLIGVHQPWRREQGGRVFNWMVRLATGLDFMDTQCGFKAFRMSTCRPVIEAALIDRFAFDVELIYVAQLAGLRLKEIPVRWDHNDGSKVDVLRDSWRMFNEVQLIRARRKRYLATINSAASSESHQQGLVPGAKELRINEASPARNNL